MRLCLALLLWVFTGMMVAQDLQLQGTVIDQLTRQPLQHVDIQLEGTSSGTTTDADGRFLLSGLTGAEISLTFSHIGYALHTEVIDPGRQSGTLRIELRSRAEELQEVQVMGVSLKDNSFRTEQVDIRSLRSSNLQDVGYLLRQVPNINGIRKGAAGIDPVIRGFRYSQLDVQVNGGTRIEGGCPNRMDPATAHVDLSDIKEMKILKGPFALKYGVNFGGVIDMTTYHPAFHEKYRSEVDVLMGGQTNHAGFKTAAGITGGNKVMTYGISGNWKKYGDYQAGNGERIASSLEQQSYAANLGFRISKQHILYAGADISQGADIDFPALPMDERKDDTKIFSLNYLLSSDAPSFHFIRFKAYLSDVNHEMDNKNRPFSDTVVAVSRIHARNTGGKLGVNFSAGEARIEAGADVESIEKDGERMKYMIMQPGLPRKEEDLWNKAHIDNLGLFVEYQKPGHDLDWIVSARLDFNTASSGPLMRTAMNGDVIYDNEDTRSQFTNISVSGGLTWHISNSSSLTASLGRGVRSPDMTERFIILLPVGYDRYDYLGNPQLKPEANHEVDLGYRYAGFKTGSVEISCFFSLVTDFITGERLPPSMVKPQTKGVLGVKRFINTGRVYLSGFEASYASPPTRQWILQFNAAYTMGWNPEATGYIYESGQVVEEEMLKNDPLPEIPPFEMNLTFGWRLFGSRLLPEASLRWVARQGRVSRAFEERTTPGFTILDLDVQYIFNDHFTIYAGVKNLLDNTYYEHLNRRIIGSMQPLYEPGRIFYANLVFKIKSGKR